MIMLKLTIAILMQVESSNGVNLYNSEEKAYGVLQIRAECLEDVNGRYGTKYTLQDCYKSHLISKWVFVHYIRMYKVDESSIEDMCRFWNAGPSYKRLGSRARTINNKHWQKCKGVYDGIQRRGR